jgi:uncharacterized membrane protein required for colicin V production
MLTQIIANTPAWVWLLLVALVWIGLAQTRARTVSIKKVAILPMIMTILSFSGTVSAFGASLHTLLAWLGAVAVTFMLWLQASPASSNHFDPREQKFALEGSWVPLGLMLGIFLVKYAVGVATALNPGLARQVNYALGVSALYGAFSGVFLARAIQTLRLTGRSGLNFSRARA